MEPDQEPKCERSEPLPEGTGISEGSGYRYPVGRWDAVLIGPGGEEEADGTDLDSKGPDGQRGVN